MLLQANSKISNLTIPKRPLVSKLTLRNDLNVAVQLFKMPSHKEKEVESRIGIIDF